jgi:hypothetical protein
MSEKTARNTYSTDNNEEYRYTLLVVLKNTLTMHDPMNVKLRIHFAAILLLVVNMCYVGIHFDDRGEFNL